MVDVDYHLNIKLADISAKKNEVEEENQTNTNYNLGKINFSEFDRQLGTDIEGSAYQKAIFESITKANKKKYNRETLLADAVEYKLHSDMFKTLFLQLKELNKRMISNRDNNEERIEIIRNAYNIEYGEMIKYLIQENLKLTTEKEKLQEELRCLLRKRKTDVDEIERESENKKPKTHNTSQYVKQTTNGYYDHESGTESVVDKVRRATYDESNKVRRATYDESNNEDQPPKKKRGRPLGSRNKLKN